MIGPSEILGEATNMRQMAMVIDLARQRTKSMLEDWPPTR
jgi:hypothetical protein